MLDSPASKALVMVDFSSGKYFFSITEDNCSGKNVSAVEFWM
jgi:hypothetical protein